MPINFNLLILGGPNGPSQKENQSQDGRGEIQCRVFLYAFSVFFRLTLPALSINVHTLFPSTTLQRPGL